MQNSGKGFTIIELIVVIAIIAVLASIVVTSVVIYIGTSRDTAVKADLLQVAKKYQIHYSENNNYNSFGLPEITLPCAQSQSSYNVARGSNDFAVFARLCTSRNFWCVDSTGKSADIGLLRPDSGVHECIVGTFCGNGACDNGENCSTCPTDCGPCCGNGVRDNGENCSNCPIDYGACCGNGFCDNGEVCNTCQTDCGWCYCGDGVCSPGEWVAGCYVDCYLF